MVEMIGPPTLDGDDTSHEATDRNELAEAAVREVTATSQVPGMGEVLHWGFAQPRPKSARPLRPHFNQSEIVRKRRLRFRRRALRHEHEAQEARSAEQVLERLQEHARTFGRPLEELLVARGDDRLALDRAIVALVTQFGRKAVRQATGYRSEQLTRAYKRGLS
jgi:hypothetical protein